MAPNREAARRGIRDTFRAHLPNAVQNQSNAVGVGQLPTTLSRTRVLRQPIP
jgi:hypothetical protein